jgi:hypothetical protein
MFGMFNAQIPVMWDGAMDGDAREKTARMPRRSALALVAMLVASIALITSVGLVSAAPANADSGVEIINGRTGLRADVMWASTTKGQGVFLWPDNTSKSQQFDLVGVNDGTGDYTIKAQHSGQCLWLGYWLTGWGNGSSVVQYPCNPQYSASRWHTEYVYYTAPSCGSRCFNGSGWRAILKNRATGKCLDAANGSYPAAPPQQARLQQWDCVTSGNAANIGNQWWKLETPGGPIIH